MIKVKALEWFSYGDVDHRSRIGMIHYDIFHDNLGDTWRWIQSPYKEVCFDTLDEAKAACQAHHEQHVLSMIEVKNG